MFSFATRCKAIRKAVTDAVDSRRKALVKSQASHSAAVARPQISTGIGTVLEMRVRDHSSLGRTKAHSSTTRSHPPPHESFFLPSSKSIQYLVVVPTSLPVD